MRGPSAMSEPSEDASLPFARQARYGFAGGVELVDASLVAVRRRRHLRSELIDRDEFAALANEPKRAEEGGEDGERPGQSRLQGGDKMRRLPGAGDVEVGGVLDPVGFFGAVEHARGEEVDRAVAGGDSASAADRDVAAVFCRDPSCSNVRARCWQRDRR